MLMDLSYRKERRVYLNPYGINRVSNNYALKNSDNYALEIEIF